MKFTKILGLVAAAALALMAFASTASATTLETNGVKQTTAVTIDASLQAGTSALLTDTFSVFANTCTGSTVQGSDTTSTTGATVSGPISALSFTSCKYETIVDVNGTLSVENIAGTTNGTVRSNGAKVTIKGTPFGDLTCTTSNTDLGTLKGVSAGAATIEINAVVNCNPLSSARWKGTYVTTTSTGANHAIGVVA